MKTLMEDGRPVGAEEGASRFELAPPRRFILPAILLLLSEHSGYGYGLVPRLEAFRFGHVDRPAVYRALAQLETDGLVEAEASRNPGAGQARREYSITPLGERVLRVWMGVIKEEHDYLGQALRRYQATGTIDAVLAEVEGGWSSALGAGWSPVSSTSGGWRRPAPLDSEGDLQGHGPPGYVAEYGRVDRGGPDGDAKHCETEAPELSSFELDPERSAVLIDVRSTVGPLSFGTLGVTGTILAAFADGLLRTDMAPSGRLTIDVSGLNSGNRLYDAELLRRIDARGYPSAFVELRECALSGPGARYRLAGELTFHGVTRLAEGTVTVDAVSDRRLVITGEQVFDIRDFAIPSPTMLMLRIYPDVRVHLHAEAARRSVGATS
jgi:DNA-binding PadR family transcriptional regulator